MKGIAILAVLCLALAGCGGKDKMSKADMAEVVDDALANLEAELGPGGRIAGGELKIPVDAGFGTLTVPLALEIGPAGDMRIDGAFGFGSNRATVAAYCSPERLVIVTTGLEQYDQEDFSLEMRNLPGTCTRLEGGTDLLGDFGGVNALVAGGDRLDLQDVRKTDGVITATYLDRATESTITVDVDDGVQVIRAEAEEGALTITFEYGSRSAITAPVADEQVAAPVLWSLQKGSSAGDPGIVTIEAGEVALSEYHVRAYPNAAVPCRGGQAPLVEFDLSRGLRQTRDGFDMDVRDDGDGILDAGDRIFLEHPDRFEEGWPYHVEIWDGWSDSSADPVCTIPGPAPVAMLALLGLLVWVRRRA
ncbi:MAG: hypothetical protein ACPHID_08110 [Thermoplasmatota archaeon]